MQPTTLFFDLDDTLYPADSGLWSEIKERISLYMHEKMGFTWQEIPLLRQRLYHAYGTSMRGLKDLYDIDEMEYLAFVHDLPLHQYLKPQPRLRQLIQSYPYRKFIFTNADRNHADRVLKVLGLEDCFEKIIDVLAISPYCKPMTQAFRIAMQAAGGADPRQCVLIDDAIPNLDEAKRLGFFTIHVGPAEDSGNGHHHLASIEDLPTIFPLT